MVAPPLSEWGHLATSGDTLGCHNGVGRRVLLASGGQRPGVLLNILQCAEQTPHSPPSRQRMTQPNGNNAKRRSPAHGQASPRLFWSIRVQRAPHRPLRQLPKQPHARSPLTRQPGIRGARGERRREAATPGGLEQRCSLRPPTIPARRTPGRGRSLVKQENVRLNSRGRPSTPPPHCPAAGVGPVSLCTGVTLTDRHRATLPGGREEAWARRAGGSAAALPG